MCNAQHARLEDAISVHLTLAERCPTVLVNKAAVAESIHLLTGITVSLTHADEGVDCQLRYISTG
jgi:hypothetical protein